MPAETPRQTNGWDCGVHVLMNALFSAFRLPLMFKESDMERCRQHIALSIMTGELDLPVDELFAMTLDEP